jgi:hypothetical protein
MWPLDPPRGKPRPQSAPIWGAKAPPIPNPPPTADMQNVQRGLIQHLNAVNISDHIIDEYTAPQVLPQSGDT